MYTISAVVAKSLPGKKLSHLISSSFMKIQFTIRIIFINGLLTNV